MSQISVVIPTLKRLGPLTRCLHALAHSFPENAETIVVSDGGCSEIDPSLLQFVERLRLRYIVAPSGGPSAARNLGLAAARGDIVAFLDDDCRPLPGWLDVLTSGVSTDPPRATGGTTFNGLTSNPYAHFAQLILDLLARHERKAYGHELFFPSNNLAFPTEALRRIGGFDESFRTAEDREVCRRWRKTGFGLIRIPEAIVEHDAQIDFCGFLSKFYAYGQGAAKFHSTGEGSSFRKSVDFHIHLPVLAPQELVSAGALRGSSLISLLVLWEFVNLAGFLTAALKRPASAPIAVKSKYGEQPS